METKADTFARLQQEINTMEDYKPLLSSVVDNSGLGIICRSFPGSVFPYGTVHEFCYNKDEDLAATTGFVAELASSLLQHSGGAGVWITTKATLFPPALCAFGVDAAKVFILHVKNEKDTTLALEEALKCKGLSAVFAELPQLDFTTSRRLQLAVESSGVTCFLLRNNPRNLTTASTARWQVSCASTIMADGMPGVGHPRWTVELQKVRNGKPGVWCLEWKAGRFYHFAGATTTAASYDWIRKVV